MKKIIIFLVLITLTLIGRVDAQNILGSGGGGGNSVVTGPDGDRGIWFSSTNTVSPTTYSTGREGFGPYNHLPYWFYNGSGWQLVTTATAASGLLTGYTSGAGTVAGTDTILQAIQKLNGNVEGKVSTTSAATFTEPTGNALVKKTGSGTVGTSYIVPAGLTADRTVTFADEDQTVANLAGTQTLSNKSLTAPIIQGREVDGHVSGNLSASDVSSTVVYNTGMGATASTLVFPAAAYGYSVIFYVGEASAAAWTIQAASAGTLWLDGEGEHNSLALATPTQGNYAVCYTAKVAGTGVYASAALAIGTTNTAVATGAFNFAIAGTGYSKAAVAAGTAPGNDVIPQSKYGAVAFDIGADGTIDAIEASDNATGYDSSALAIAGLAAAEAAHIRLGTVTATKSDGDFTFGTTALDAANTTVAYASTAAYTPAYNWFCKSGTSTAWAHE